MYRDDCCLPLAVLVCIDFGDSDYNEDVAEFKLLVHSSGYRIVDVIDGKRQAPDAALFIGRGKVADTHAALLAHHAQLVLFNHNLSGVQQRNLERQLHCRVIDRTQLILILFAQRTRTMAARLQVELAQMQYLSTRLVRGWSHLERQRGGIGNRGGPGERQLELDRRQINDRIKRLKDKIERVVVQRRTQRRARQRHRQYSIALIGYTNAGKSTLFKCLTGAEAYIADQLFATLQTTSRRMFLNSQYSPVLSDTVGFIRRLPHTLVVAFKATLEETAHADLLLHVIDSASETREDQCLAVNKVLDDIGAGGIAQVVVWNKIDLSGAEAGIEYDDFGNSCAVRVSAVTGEGIALLRQVLVEKINTFS